MRVHQEIWNIPGYFTGYTLTIDELDILRSLVDADVRRLLQYGQDFYELTAKNFHQYYDPKTQVMEKSNRFFSKENVEKIKKFQFFDQIRRDLGEFDISRKIDEDGVILEDEEMYWRVVRPNERSGVGGLHADVWFAEVLNYSSTLFGNRKTLKLWIPIHTEISLNGLEIVPNSHHDEFIYDVVYLNGHPRPRMDERLAPKTTLLEVGAGQIVAFGDRLLHKGAVNRGNYCRVSMEVTLIFR